MLEVVVSVLILYSMVYYNTVKVVAVVVSCNTSMYVVSSSIQYYYIDESVLLGTKPLVDSIRHFIRDPSGVFSVCHLCERRIVQ